MSRPAWHVPVTVGGLLLALAGAVMISLAKEAANRTGAAEVAGPSATT